MVALPAQAQQPSKAETDAVRSNCRSDYMSKCMSVKPGGIEAIQCLKKNDASLSPACRSAVAAIKLPGEAPAAAAKPATPPPAAAATPAPGAQPAPAPAAPSSATTVPNPAEPAASVATPAKPEAPKRAQPKPAAAPKAAVAAAPPVPAPVAAPTPPAAASSQPKPPTLREAQLVRRFCTVDYQVLCKGVRIGGGRVVKCLSDNQGALSPSCKGAIAKAQ